MAGLGSAFIKASTALAGQARGLKDPIMDKARELGARASAAGAAAGAGGIKVGSAALGQAKMAGEQGAEFLRRNAGAATALGAGAAGVAGIAATTDTPPLATAYGAAFDVAGALPGAENLNDEQRSALAAYATASMARFAGTTLKNAGVKLEDLSTDEQRQFMALLLQDAVSSRGIGQIMRAGAKANELLQSGDPADVDAMAAAIEQAGGDTIAASPRRMLALVQQGQAQ